MDIKKRIMTESPLNAEPPTEALRSWITPIRAFFNRNQGAIPEHPISLQDWRLTITGEVKRELVLTYEDLLQLPKANIANTLECSGNGRSLLKEKAPGNPWTIGGVALASSCPNISAVQSSSLFNSLRKVLSGVLNPYLASSPQFEVILRSFGFTKGLSLVSASTTALTTLLSTPVWVQSTNMGTLSYLLMMWYRCPEKPSNIEPLTPPASSFPKSTSLTMSSCLLYLTGFTLTPASFSILKRIIWAVVAPQTYPNVLLLSDSRVFSLGSEANMTAS